MNVPLSTRKYESRPTKSSASVLKICATTGPSGSDASSPSGPLSDTVRGLTSFGAGSSVAISSSSGRTPISRVAEVATTGTNVPARIAPFNPFVISSSVSSSPSRNFNVRSSSDSAIRSTTASRASATASAIASGASSPLPSSPIKACPLSTSTTPSSPPSTPIGICSG